VRSPQSEVAVTAAETRLAETPYDLPKISEARFAVRIGGPLGFALTVGGSTTAGSRGSTGSILDMDVQASGDAPQSWHHGRGGGWQVVINRAAGLSG